MAGKIEIKVDHLKLIIIDDIVLHFKIERNIASGSRILSGSSYSAKPLKKKSTEKEKIVKFLRNTSSDIQVIFTFNRTVMNLPRNIFCIA